MLVLQRSEMATSSSAYADKIEACNNCTHDPVIMNSYGGCSERATGGLGGAEAESPFNSPL